MLYQLLKNFKKKQKTKNKKQKTKNKKQKTKNKKQKTKNKKQKTKNKKQKTKNKKQKTKNKKQKTKNKKQKTKNKKQKTKNKKQHKKQYENYANELSTVRDSCIKKIEFLRENCKKASIEFEATADALAQAGIAFTHPEVLLNKQTAELKKLSVTHRNQLFEADRKDNEEELAELNRLLDQTAL